MGRLKLWGALAAILILVLGGLGAWWANDLRWRPKTITKNAAEITRLLEGAGWVSPGATGPRLYMVSFRTCPDCIRYKQSEFPALQAAGIDTRVIMIARADKNGVANSTPAERATVAELWVNRNWALLDRWMNTAPAAWTAQGLAAADADVARTAVVEASRRTVEDLRPLLADNGVRFAYPTLVWWTRDGKMRACACEKAQTWGHIRRDLGVEG